MSGSSTFSSAPVLDLGLRLLDGRLGLGHLLGLDHVLRSACLGGVQNGLGIAQGALRGPDVRLRLRLRKRQVLLRRVELGGGHIGLRLRIVHVLG